IGVAAMDVTVAVMGGFEEYLKDRFIGQNAHARVSQKEAFAPPADFAKTLTSVKGVTAVTPYTYAELLLLRDTYATGIAVKGIDLDTIGDVTEIPSEICLESEIADECGKHRGDALAERRAVLAEIATEHDINESGKKVPGILLGRDLADEM